MTPFTTLTATACPLPFSGIDTDQLIPARFMKRPRAEGYGQFLLHDLRFGADGADGAATGFPLDAPQFSGAQILVARRGFGGGSSREAAVYALVDYGIRCVIAPSFGDIHASNAVNNGVLPARVSEADAETLLSLAAETPLTVNLEAQTITAGTTVIGFEIEPVWRTKLLNGWNDIDLTRSHQDAIAAFAAKDAATNAWKAPNVAD